MYVLKDKELRMEVIWLHYDIQTAEHGEKQKTMKLVTRNYWWPKVTKDIGKYVDEYDMCQKIKN